MTVIINGASIYNINKQQIREISFRLLVLSHFKTTSLKLDT